MDHYYKLGKSNVNMKELILLSLFVITFGAMALYYVKRSVQNDFATIYESENPQNREQVSWHSLTNDLLRPPPEPQGLAVMVGMGA